MNRESLSSILLLFAFLIFIISSTTFPVLCLQYNMGIPSYGTINYSIKELSRLHVDGKYLKDSSGKIVVLRGVCFQSDQWWGQGIYSENQFIYMKNWGCNTVRIGIQCYTLEEITDSSGNIINSDFLSRLDQLIGWAQAQGLYVLLNGFHPAGQCLHGNLRVECSHYLPTHWGGANWTNWINLWKQYATRYKGMGVMYKILSEPIDCSYSVYQSRVRACVDAIRAIDSNAIVVVDAEDPTTQYICSFAFEQNGYGISRANIIYCFQQYASHFSSNTQQTLRDHFNTYELSDWMLANGRCVMATEFGDSGPYSPTTTYAFNDYPEWNTVWLDNFMTVLDADGYSGYYAFRWCRSDAEISGLFLLGDWNGNPSNYGNVIRSYYSTH